MRIAIVGAGAVGGWLAAHLARAGEEVSLFARGATLEAVRRNGLCLVEGGESWSRPLPASDDAAALGPQDLVVVAVKAPALAAAAPAVAAMLGPDTVVMPAMNGVPWWFPKGLGPPLEGSSLFCVDPDGRIAASIPSARVIGCVVHASCAQQAPARVVHHNGNGLILGEPDGKPSERLQRSAAAFARAGFAVSESAHIHQDIWYKLWGNLTMNPISALTRATVDRIIDDALIVEFILKVMAEAAEIGRRIGCPIAESGEARIAIARRLGAFKTSMLQDVEAGRPLEVDALVAAPREIAARLGMPTPHMDALHGLIRLLAASLAGA